MRGYMLGRKRAVRAAEKVHYDHLTTLVRTAEPFCTGDFSSHAATPEPSMISGDHATVAVLRIALQLTHEVKVALKMHGTGMTTFEYLKGSRRFPWESARAVSSC